MKAKFRVTIDLREPQNHRAIVSIEAIGKAELPELLRFPVWTPGSYLVRDYSRHITRLDHGKKIAKNVWRLKGPRDKVSYEVYCLERSVRTSYVDDHYASLVGATLLPLLHAPFEIHILLPRHWSFVSSALKFRLKRAGHFTALARGDDHWIDSPVVAASPGFGGQQSFSYHGIRHHIAWVGTECARPAKDLERDFRKIVDATIKMFGAAPFREYWFLLHFGAKLYGGLEHRDSQLSQFDGSALSEEKDYEAFLRLIAHEYFHAWNVKSLRPQALGPFDYEEENYTEELWFAEGLTDYFDDMIPLHAGLITEEAYKKSRLKGLQNFGDGLPAQFRRSVGESSFDAWIRYYRNDEDTDNTDVSYYTKGALLCWCWDAELQRRSRGKWTLAKLLRAIWEEFGIDAYKDFSDAKPGYTRDEIIDFAKKKTGINHDFLEIWVNARKPLPWREAAKFFKISFHEKVVDLFLHFTGAQLHWKNGQALISKVLSGSAAEAAGIAPGDELLALGDWRASESERVQTRWKRILHDKKAVTISICRLEKISHIKIKPRAHKGIGVSAELA